MGQKRLVLTGGPCAGKTTALGFVSRKLKDYGTSVIVVPEVATSLINAGLHPKDISKDDMAKCQELFMRTQLHFEDEIFGPALALKGGDRQVLICDRGCMDSKAYMSTKDFEKLLIGLGKSEVDLRDRRYEAIFHLVTAAEGREKYYNLDNPARTETPEQARVLDLRTRNAWIGHPHLRVIDNGTLFDKKLKRLLNAMRKALGIPVAIETERKFLLHDEVDLKKIPVAFQIIDIEQHYINDVDGKKIRVRSRSQRGEPPVYYKTIKLKTSSSMSRIEIEEQILEADYYNMVRAQSDPDFEPIIKQRICFLWQHQYFELDILQQPTRHNGLTLLEIELTEENDKVTLPRWLGKMIEVTDDHTYKNQNLAKHS